MENAPVRITWLSGIRVLVMGHYVPAPFAAYCLRQLGATVVKLEDLSGDHLRQMGKFIHAQPSVPGPMFSLLNAGFQSISVDFRKPQGRDLLRALLPHFDILLDGQRLGALARHLGDSPTAVAPPLIYVPITAYGLAGPMAHLAGHDNNVLALGGNLSYTSTDAAGLPAVFSAPVADLFAGQMAAMSALAAVIGRGTQGTGTTIDASMLHAGFFLNALELAARNMQDAVAPAPGAAWMNGGRPDYRPYRCADGKVIFYGLLEPWLAQKFYGAIGRADLLPLMQQPEALRAALQTMFLERPAAEWMQLGTQYDACITVVQDLEAAVAHPQVQALGRVQRVAVTGAGEAEMPSFPVGIGQASVPLEVLADAPRLGAHNRTLLQDLLGLQLDAITELEAAGVLRAPDTNDC